MTTTQTSTSTWLRRRPAVAALATLAVIGAAGAVAFWPGDDTEKLQADGDTTVTTAAPTSDDPDIVSERFDLANVNWDEVEYPMDCGSTGAKVLDQRLATPQSGHHVAVVLAACDAGAGSPPRSIFVYDSATSATQPHLLQTLSTDGLSRMTGTIRADGATVVASGTSYSDDTVPRCCPDGTFTTSWTWNGGGYSTAS